MKIRMGSVGISRLVGGAFLAASGGFLGCDGAAPYDDYSSPYPDEGVGGTVIGVGGGAGSLPTKGGGSGFLDLRPVVNAARTPPPISGGTMLVRRASDEVVIADPDRDRIQLVSLGGRFVAWTAPLEAGAEPGRLAEDAAGRIHALLRGTGELLTLDPARGEIVEQKSVCEAPRGIAYDTENDAIVVACQEGILVEFPAEGGEAVRITEVAPDLRDVAFAGELLVATLFRSSEILLLDAERRITARRTPLAQEPGFESAVAWRAVSGPDGTVTVAHQLALATPIDVGEGGSGGGDGEGDGIAGGVGKGGTSSSGYGGVGQPCSAIVRSVVTVVDADGNLSTSAPLASVTSPVDVAVAFSGRVALANAAFDELSSQFGATASVGTFQAGVAALGGLGCVFPDSASFGNGAAIAVAFDEQNDLLVAQQREPARLVAYDLWGGEAFDVALGGASVLDTGHQMFHMDSGAGIACVSCHAEGGDDGHVWHFAGQGQRRTQPLDVGLEGTAPFHWVGDMDSFGTLVHEVFERRMSGPIQSPERIAALEQYMYRLPRRPAIRPADDPAAERGRVLFESEALECTDCHEGPTYTNGRTVTVGREMATQVPSLIGVGLRAPYMHDGCAATLRDRFDPACGGSDHGDVSTLSDEELDDLIAFLESL